MSVHSQRHYFNNTDALIYVVDSCDRERIGRAASEFKVRSSSMGSGMLYASERSYLEYTNTVLWLHGKGKVV